MPTTITKTVKSTGGDYTSLSAWEAGEQANLVTLDQIRQAECYAMSDTTQTTLLGWTTDATRYPRIYTPASERHDGKWNASKYRIEASVRCINNATPYLRIEGIQAAVTFTSISQAAIYGGNAAAVSVSQCIVKRDAGNLGDAGIWVGTQVGAKIWNNIIYDFNGSASQSGILFQNTGYSYNNTVQNCSIGYNRITGVSILKNCVAQNCTDGYGGTWDAASDYNLSDLASDAPGANSKNSTTVTFVDAAGDNFHLATSDTGALGAGTDLSADPNLAFTDDIDSQPRRAGSWSMGADGHAGISIAGTMTSSGAMANVAQQVLSGSMASSATMEALHLFFLELAGAMASSGAGVFLKVLELLVTGAMTGSGGLLNQAQISLAGAMPSSGAMLKSVQQLLQGAMASSGLMSKFVEQLLLAAMASSGSMTHPILVAWDAWSLFDRKGEVLFSILDWLTELTQSGTTSAGPFHEQILVNSTITKTIEVNSTVTKTIEVNSTVTKTIEVNSTIK